MSSIQHEGLPEHPENSHELGLSRLVSSLKSNSVTREQIEGMIARKKLGLRYKAATDQTYVFFNDVEVAIEELIETERFALQELETKVPLLSIVSEE